MLKLVVDITGDRMCFSSVLGLTSSFVQFNFLFLVLRQQRPSGPCFQHHLTNAHILSSTFLGSTGIVSKYLEGYHLLEAGGNWNMRGLLVQERNWHEVLHSFLKEDLHLSGFIFVLFEFWRECTFKTLNMFHSSNCQDLDNIWTPCSHHTGLNISLGGWGNVLRANMWLFNFGSLFQLDQLLVTQASGSNWNACSRQYGALGLLGIRVSFDFWADEDGYMFFPDHLVFICIAIRSMHDIYKLLQMLGSEPFKLPCCQNILRETM